MEVLSHISLCYDVCWVVLRPKGLCVFSKAGQIQNCWSSVTKSNCAAPKTTQALNHECCCVCLVCLCHAYDKELTGRQHNSIVAQLRHSHGQLKFFPTVFDSFSMSYMPNKTKRETQSPPLFMEKVQT